MNLAIYLPEKTLPLCKACTISHLIAKQYGAGGGGVHCTKPSTPQYRLSSVTAIENICQQFLSFQELCAKLSYEQILLGYTVAAHAVKQL